MFVYLYIKFLKLLFQILNFLIQIIRIFFYSHNTHDKNYLKPKKNFYNIFINYINYTQKNYTKMEEE